MPLLLLLSLLQSPVPTLDGTIAPGEWDRATHATGTGQLEVWTLSTDSALYVAVRGAGDGFPHLGIARGDTVLILHASAALGTARFVGPGEVKRRVGEWEFRVRGGEESEGSGEAREFYRQEGWVATTIRMGRAGETEFKISRRLLNAFPASPASLAVAYWAEGQGVTHWPAGVNDDFALERMVQGFLPEEARFRPETWQALP
jgi:hypothetical protein